MNPYCQYPYVIAPYYHPLLQVPQYGGWSLDPRNVALFPPTFAQAVQSEHYLPTSQPSATFPCQFTQMNSVPQLQPCPFSQMNAAPQPQPPVNVSQASFPTQFSQKNAVPQPQQSSISENSHNTFDLIFQGNTTDNSDARRNVADIEDLMDANLAGTSHSLRCTLILTEGRAAMSLAVTGLPVIGRDTYGVYAMKRRLINVCKSSEDKVKSYPDVKNITKILGLQYDFTYETDEELGTLRYGNVLLMMDRDEDGSHMKGLIINLFYKYWPYLLRRNGFILQFITPAVKASCLCGCNHEILFYTVEEHDDWVLKMSDASNDKYVTKHYRSLESFTAQEIKKYFSNLLQHCVYFRYEDLEDDEALTLAFEKNLEDSRKDWMSRTMRESFVYCENLREIRYKDFINRELLFYSDLQNLRSLPSAIDGLTRSQRKVLHAYFKRHCEQEVSVLRLMGSVFDVSAYKQSMDALSQTIINMAQDFVGTNNVNIFMPIGQFGNRMHGGEDSGKSKYLYTKLNPIMKYIFSELDFPLLSYLKENDMLIEPSHYLPIIPMILVNGSEGIGTGWRTKIPKYNPNDVIENLLRMLGDSRPLAMVPYFKEFKGRIESSNDSEFNSYGVISVLDGNRVRITELPVGVWTKNYKEKVLKQMLGENILHYEEYHTDKSVDFVLTLRDLNSIPDLYVEFQLKTSEKSYFVAFNNQGRVRDYGSPIEILEEYFDVRLSAYDKRKTYMEEKLQFHLKKLEDLHKEIRFGDGNMVRCNLRDGGYDFVYDVRRIQEKGVNALENDIRNTKEKLEQLQQKSPRDMWREELIVLRDELVVSSLNTLSLE